MCVGSIKAVRGPAIRAALDDNATSVTVRNTLIVPLGSLRPLHVTPVGVRLSGSKLTISKLVPRFACRRVRLAGLGMSFGALAQSVGLRDSGQFNSFRLGVVLNIVGNSTSSRAGGKLDLTTGLIDADMYSREKFAYERRTLGDYTTSRPRGGGTVRTGRGLLGRGRTRTLTLATTNGRDRTSTT